MTVKAESIKRLLLTGRITEDRVENMYTRNIVSIEEYHFILDKENDNDGL